ncbi:hypothetical protein ACFLRM_01690 [Acidobacteriota bacterium]
MVRLDKGVDKEKVKFNLQKFQTNVNKRLKQWKEKDFIRRLWAKDPELWFSSSVPEITDRLGWLRLPEIMGGSVEKFFRFTEGVKDDGITHVVLLGMGGSSLAPEVFQRTFGNKPGNPELKVLDSTHPDAVRSVEEEIELPKTLFLVSSKSGTTLETISLFRYFWRKIKHAVNVPGKHFAAITDPGTNLIQLARERDFRMVFESMPDVGGRYSAFTAFGLVPAALIGLDVSQLLKTGRREAEHNAFPVSEDDASSLVFGAAMGELAPHRDKLTFFTSPSLSGFPDWLEQLIAESTGKEGKGIIPVVNEPSVPVDFYGQDRFFVFIFYEGDKDHKLKNEAKKLEAAGHPMICVSLSEKEDLGSEIFRWEIAVASAGSVLGIHPFNQPDVQLAKHLAREEMAKGETQNRTDAKTENTIDGRDEKILGGALEIWINEAHNGDYIALQAYLAPNREKTTALQKIRLGLLQGSSLATTIGYGPRFLHSTGQLHKGGPNKGLFLQLVDEPKMDLGIPETGYSFNRLIQAQSWGDFLALKQRGRRVLRVNFKGNVLDGLEQLQELVFSRI